MFSTTTGIKRSLYSQTGNFQFQTDLVLDSVMGFVNIGVSGFISGNVPSRIDFLFNSGKIWDNNRRFVGIYNSNSLVSISGNITSEKYDYFINSIPIVYGNHKSTGTYNYIYINPVNVNCEYNMLVNGEQPNLSISNIDCFSGAAAGSGYITNNNLPVTIFSGRFTNFSDNLPFSFSEIFTGQLNKDESGVFYVYPTTGGSVGLYTGNLELTTNGGILLYNSNINITGSPIVYNYSFDLNGLDYIIKNNTQSYYSNIECNSGSGIPIVVSLEYYSGSGSNYTGINVISGFTRTISGYIVKSGYLISGNSVTGIGTGMGGHYNNTGTGFASGYISGNLQYATGSFTWPYPSLLVSGLRTGVNYTGIATGLNNVIVAANIVGLQGTYLHNTNFTGNSANVLYNTGVTGYIYATGKIYYNVPEDYDVFYIKTKDIAHSITKYTDYTTIDDLETYINTNSSLFSVNALKDTANTIALSGFYGQVSNSYLLSGETTNVGTMTFSENYLTGGVDLGVGAVVFNTSLPFTGHLNHTFTGSGNYSQTISGYITGSGIVLNYRKTFTGSWNLFTGNDLEQVNYHSGGLYNVAQTKYLNTGNPAYYIDSMASIYVHYNNPYDNISDIAILRISGLNFNTGLYIYITGTTGLAA